MRREGVLVLYQVVHIPQTPFSPPLVISDLETCVDLRINNNKRVIYMAHNHAHEDMDRIRRTKEETTVQTSNKRQA